MIRIARMPFTYPPTLLHLTCSFLCSSFSVFDSQYHQKGVLPIKKPKNVERLLKNINWELDTKISQIQQKRKLLNQKNILIKSAQQYQHSKQKSQQLEEYLKNYQNLTKIISKCQLNNEWIYQLIGWYNITHYYKPLVERLLESSGKQTQFLIDALALMKYQWKNSYGVIDEELRANRKIQTFYKDLSNELSIEHLKKLQDIVIAPLVITKRNFYEHYAARHLQDWLKTIREDDTQGIDNIIWLYQRCIINMMDQEYIISKVQKYLLTTKMQLSNQNIQKLMNVYTLKGRINKNIYNQYIKPYIGREKMKNISNIIEAIKFVICSQCQDNAMLKNLYEMLEVHYQSDKMKLKNSRDKYYLHLYTHYLRVKGYKIKLNQVLEKQLHDFCRQKAEGRQTLNKIIYQNKNNHYKLKNKYVSQCLNIKNYALKEYDTTKRSVFQANFRSKLLQIQLNELKIYEKPILCCFQLDFCLHKQSSNELTDIQIEGMQYVFGSGRLIRSRQIRDEILTYYGVKINHIDYNSFKAKSRISQESLLMTKRLFQNK